MSSSEVLMDVINEDEKSHYKKDMEDGVNYYKADNDITDEDFTKYVDRNGITQYQDNKANNKLVHSFLFRLITEKVAYLLKEPLVITHEDEKVIDEIKELLGNQFDDIMTDWTTNASQKGGEWLHPFLNGKEFDYMIMDAEQIIPIYETTQKRNLFS